MDGGFTRVQIPYGGAKTKIRALVDSQLVIFDQVGYASSPSASIEFSYRIPLLYHPNNGIKIQIIIKKTMEVIIGPYPYKKIECRDFNIANSILEMDHQACLPCS
jgi:hypothetical protein